ncbi:ABC transporter substrate binding protein [Candidatus Arcanobacter lacustris]|uniref:ABC transporter substrate binding protein n=1 Tax=Candidatus Arcanibacter lacustris TaxID=1607817 RepID=A0A0F5MQC8_9RICK|nr:ABC transporter substrate binding protein [Candidatus Arcanobacter lacustris]
MRLVVLYIVLLSIVIGNVNADTSKVSLAVSQTVSHPALDETLRGILDELNKQGFVIGDNLDYKYFCAQGDVILSNQIAAKIISNRPDYAISIGTTSSQSLLNANRANDIPIIFSSVTDPVAAKLVKDLNAPEKNITGVSNFIDVGPQLDLFKKILPNLSKVGFVYNSGEVNSVKILQVLKEAAATRNIEIITSVATKASDVSQGINKLVGKVDAIFISNDNTALSAFSVIVKIALANKVPLFVSDTDLVSQGALASMGPSQYELGRQAGKMIVRLIKGEKISNIRLEFPSKIDVVINEKIAKELGITIPKELLKK